MSSSPLAIGVSTPIPSYLPEDCPFETVIVDVTHRCNMACLNCYIPNRTIPDLDRTWLESIFARLPKGRFIRLVGAEPTMRRDLTDLVRDIRRNRHHPVLVTNGLKLADSAYVATLRASRLRTIYLSMNGGFDDDLYDAIDGMRCATAKGRALDNVCKAGFYVSVGMILVRGINEHYASEMIDRIRRTAGVRELHFRSVAELGRSIDRPPFSLHEMIELVCTAAGRDPRVVSLRYESGSAAEFDDSENLRIHMTQWPDLGSTVRGRLTPEGRVEPFFEHVIANEGGY
jgi:molybdenum cofactor biosynthesis enzyme MoaA